MSILKKQNFYYTFLFFLFILIYGELDFRLLPKLTRLNFDVHDHLYARLSPNQIGFDWIAAMSKKSPPVVINSYSLRGPEPEKNYTGFRVLTVGSSSAFGTGVRDEETWAAQLQELLRHKNIDAEVLNGANPGWGPHQFSTMIRIDAPKLNPEIIIVAVSYGDLNFLPKASEDEKQQYLANARLRKKILGISPFVTFSLRKAEVIVVNQINKIKFILSDKKTNKPNKKEQEIKQVGKTKKLLEKNRPYFNAIVEYGKSNQIPVVFFLRNAEGRAPNDVLRDYFISLAEQKEGVYFGAITPSDLSLSAGDDVAEYVRNNLIIPNDGHPNKRYHYMMANSVLPTVIKAIQDTH